MHRQYKRIDMRQVRFCLLGIMFVGFCCTGVVAQVMQLDISNDNRYLVTEDGEPFFWLGGTAWELIHRLSREEADHYLTNRQSKGFTVIQTVILAEIDGLHGPNAYGHRPLINDDPTKINEAYFRHVDYVLKEAEQLGMYIGLLPTWGDKYHKAWGVGPEIFTPENAEIYGEILGKRYAGQSNIIWILGGDRWPEDEEDVAIINAMAKGLRNFDKKHLITFHPTAPHLASDFFNEDWLDFDMFQAGHDRTGRDYELVWKGRKVLPARPVVNGEPRYENHPDRFDPEKYGWMDDSDVRSAAYWSMLAGAAGYTYGCHDIWQMNTIEVPPINGARTNWDEAIHLPGSGQLKYLKGLLLSFPWQQMENDQSILLSENQADSSFIVASIGNSKDFMLIYTPLGKSIIPDLSRLNADQVKAFWYNPRDGYSVKIDEYRSDESHEFRPWSAGKGSDFVLVVMDIHADYSLPEK